MSGSGGTREGRVRSDDEEPGREVALGFLGLDLGFAGGFVAAGTFGFLATGICAGFDAADEATGLLLAPSWFGGFGNFCSDSSLSLMSWKLDRMLEDALDLRLGRPLALSAVA
jgi:hypothetical protein